MLTSLRSLLIPSVCSWLGLLLTVSSCKKEETPLEQLPGATQEGRQTAGWLLDGQARVPRSSSISINPPINGSWRKTKAGHSLGLSFVYFSRNEKWGINFFVPDIRQTGTFTFNRFPAITSGLANTGYGQYAQTQPDPIGNYYTGPDALGRLVITRFDTINDIVSGTFEMSPRQDGGGATVDVTHGRFDLHFER